MAVMECGICMQVVPEDEKWRSLILAIFDQAIKDVKTGYVESFKGEAETWLLSTGHAWLVAMGIDVEQEIWVSWVKAGCPGYREEEKGNGNKSR